MLQHWTVTNAGLLEKETGYFIEASALGLCEHTRFTPYDRLTPMWVAQLSRKSWVDLDAFFSAFRRALRIHSGRYNPLPDDWHERATETINKAKRDREMDRRVRQQIRQNRGDGESDEGHSSSLEEYLTAAYQVGADPLEIEEGAEAFKSLP